MAIPPSGSFNADDGATQGEHRQWLEDLRDVVAALQTGAVAPESLTISTGVVTPTQNAVVIDTQSAAATDDLDNINVTNLPEGTLLLVRAADNGRSVVVKHLSGGSGQIDLTGDLDLELNNVEMYLWLQRVGTTWIEVGRFGLESAHVVGAAGEPPWDDGAWFSGGGPVRFWKDPHGIVRVEGLPSRIDFVPANSDMFTLPVGYRPSVDLIFALPYSATVGGTGVAIAIVRSDGQINVERPSPGDDTYVFSFSGAFQFLAVQ